MTADDAGVNGRERLARQILDALKVQEDADPLMYVGDQSRDDKPLSAVILDGFFSLTALADAILAADFGDVAEAKFAALSDYIEHREVPRIKVEFTNQPVFDEMIRRGKEAAWIEGAEHCSDGPSVSDHAANPYRTTDTNEASE